MHIIGSGQFGEVWKAHAYGIVTNDTLKNIVAVKVTKGEGRDCLMPTEVVKVHLRE